MAQSSGDRKLGIGSSVFIWIRCSGATGKVTFGSAHLIQVACVHRREPADSAALFGAGNLLFPVSFEPDPGSRLFRHRDGSRCDANDPLLVLPLALVRRISL